MISGKTMIPSVDDALKQLLRRQIPLSEEECAISFDLPNPTWSALISGPTINLYLFEIKENSSYLRNQPPPPLQDSRFPPIQRELARLDLFYLVSCWAPSAFQQHTLLSQVIRAVLQVPVLPDEWLPSSLKGQSRSIRLRIAQDENLPSITDLWSSLGSELRPGVRLVITLPVEPPALPETLPLTPTEVRLATEPNPADPARSELGSRYTVSTTSFPLAFHLISGRLRSQKHPNAMFKLVLRESGQEFFPDREGEFRITRLQEGEYHLDILINGRLVKQQVLHVPSTFIEIEI
jgi:hypothetical protein